MSQIEQPGNTPDSTQFSVKKPILAATQGQDYRIIRSLFYYFGVIPAGPPGPVTPAYQHEVFYVSLLHRFYHLICYLQDCITSKSR